MTREDKDLLLKDLCARLPYRVKILIGDSNTPETFIATNVERLYFNGYNGKEKLPIPYLRPMSSMTEEEENVYNSLNAYDGGSFPHTEDAFDWLNAHHFDYRGLIEKGLALVAPDGMYDTKN